MSKLVKGIKKAASGIVRGVKKVFKKITSSTIGKIILLVIAIYLGGAAFGAWQSPFASVNGAFVSGAAETAGAGAGAGVGAETVGAVAPEVIAGEGVVAAEGLGGAGSAAALSEPGAATISKGLSLTPEVTSVAKAPSTLSRVGSAIKGMGSSAAQFAKESPLPTAIGVSALSGAMSADAARKAEEEERKRRQQELIRNLSVGGIDLGISPGARPVRDPFGGLNSRIRG